MPALNLFKRNADKPRLSIRERFRNAAARVMPRSHGSRAGSGTDTSRRAVVVGSLASVAMAPAAAMAAAAGADAELLRLAREHDAAYELATKGGLEGDAFDDCCDAYTDLEFAIQDIPAQTWAGIVEKARIAAEYAYDQEHARVLDNIIPSLVGDICRLAGVTPKHDTKWR